MPSNCAAFGCFNTLLNTADSHPKISFYRFSTRPWKKQQMQVWIDFVKRKGKHGRPWQPSQHSRICSSHFVGNSKSEDPRNPSFNPTIHPARKISINTLHKQDRYKRLKVRQAKNNQKNDDDAIIVNGFDFNPTLLFVCRFCRHSFDSTETLKEHKLACHLGECMGIKCIVFEERLLNTEWRPEHNLYENRNATSNANHENGTSLTECKTKIQLADVSATETSFKNPYVSLTRLKEEEINKGWNKNKCNDRQEKSFRKIQHLQSSKDGIHSEEQVQIKKEFHFCHCESSAPEHLALNEGSCTNLENVQDPDPGFILSSDPPIFDKVPQVEFESTLIPDPTQEYQLLQHQPPTTTTTTTTSNPDLFPNSNASFAHSENQHQQINCKNEVNDFNADLSSLQIKMDIYESDSDLAEEIQEPEQQFGELIQVQVQDHQSASVVVVNGQSKTATSKKVTTPFKCKICCVTFRNKITLTNHMVCHSSVKPFKCSNCPKEFKRKVDLKPHEVVHGKETKFKCRFCSKSFSHNQNLLYHESSHTGDKPFKCPVANCDYKTASKCALAVHTRSIHGEELRLQQFLCPTCGKTFGARSYLDTHIRNLHSEVWVGTGTAESVL